MKLYDVIHSLVKLAILLPKVRVTEVCRFQGLWWAIVEGRVSDPFYTKAEAIAHIHAHKPGWCAG